MDTGNYKNAIIDITLVLLGFCLGIVWDIIKDTRQEEGERTSIILMLQSELGAIHAGINSNLQTIEANLQFLENKKEVVGPLLLLETDAWESAKLRNNIFIKNTGDLFKLVNLYSGIHIINEKIRFRENYRMAKQGTSNYQERLKIIDNDIKQVLEKFKGLCEIAQEYLHKDYPLFVNGYSFTLEKGKVEETNEGNK